MNKCLIGIAKNEDLYVTEWLRHYAGLGFRRAVLFDHGTSPSLKAIVARNGLDRFCMVDERFVGNPKFCQLKAYKLAFETYKPYFDWMAFLDVDEFMSVDGPIDDWLSDPLYSGFDGIRMHWRIHGDNGLVRYEARPVAERFRDYLPMSFPDNVECKTILRTSAPAGNFSCHGARGVRLCDTLGKPCESYWEKNEGPVVWDRARIEHYRTKTIEEFIRQKWTRGDDWNEHSNKLHMFFKVNNRTQEKLAVVKELTGMDSPPDSGTAGMR